MKIRGPEYEERDMTIETTNGVTIERLISAHSRGGRHDFGPILGGAVWIVVYSDIKYLLAGTAMATFKLQRVPAAGESFDFPSMRLGSGG